MPQQALNDYELERLRGIVFDLPFGPSLYTAAAYNNRELGSLYLPRVAGSVTTGKKEFNRMMSKWLGHSR